MSWFGASTTEAVLANKKGCGKGKVAIVTGANTGIGKYTAQALASVGFDVVIAGRNLKAIDAAKQDIDSQLASNGDGQGKITVLKTPLDLGSIVSIKTYVQDFLEQKLPLHVLVNNAGVSGYSQRTTEGMEYTMGVNWFGGFLLTNLLMDVLKASQPSRVVIVSSGLHRRGHISLENMQKLVFPDQLTGWKALQQAYNDSKLANVLHAKVLAKRLEGTGVSVFSLHPGVIRTEITRNVGSGINCILNCCSCLFRSTSQGASTTVYCATEEGLEKHSGLYFQDCGVTKTSNTAVSDDAICDAMWKLGEELTQKFAQIGGRRY